MSKITMLANLEDLKELAVPKPEDVKSLVIWDADMPQDDVPTFRLRFSRALVRFQSLRSLSLQGKYASLIFRSAMHTIIDWNIPLVELELDEVHWACFNDIPACWETVFANLKSLYIDIHYEYEHNTDESALGLKTVLGWALSVEHLYCKMQWDLFLDDFAVDTSWPSLRTLCVGRCSVTKGFLLGFVTYHREFQQLDMNAFLFEEKKDKSPIPFEDARKMFSLPLFHSLKGEISQDNEYKDGNYGHGNWGTRSLQI
ncbi:hypothetical protein DL98DRAFT_521784 [Cadophora sp. DSE1049]|nr:hypothetical protein DL98DRAFT_521784 [Cadophora sp. DSE1049]